MNKIWIITGVGVLVIMAGAVMVSQQTRNMPERLVPVITTAIPATPPVMPPVMPSGPGTQTPPAASPGVPPAVQKAVQPPPSHVGFTGGKDVGIDKWGRPVLLLDKLARTLKLNVPALGKADQRLPLVHTCFRANISPALTWQGAPRATKSFVVFLEKKEQGTAPLISWALFDVPADYKGLKENLPKQLEPGKGMKHARSDQNATEYVGPCDPKGKVPYVMRLFALDTVLDLPAGLPDRDLMRAMNGHIIDMAEAPFIHYLTF